MKILYFFDWKENGKAGVVKKVRDQISSWQSQGILVEILLLTGSPDQIKFPVPMHEFRYRNSLQRLHARRQAFKYAMTNRTEWILYRRYALMTLIEIRALRKMKTVIELNTNNRVFYRQRGVVQCLWFLAQDVFVTKLSIAACAVTEEIRKQNFGRYRAIEVFTNAIDLSLFVERSITRTKQNLVFLAGADFAWNGMEILKSLANSLPDYNIDVYGSVELNNQPNNIIVKPFISDKSLREILPEYVAGIASLQLENIGLSEAAPLKTRQYLLHGLPVIGRFPDSGIDLNFEYYFIVNFDMSNRRVINVNDLHEFLANCKKIIIKKDYLKGIDVNFVETRRIQFISNYAH